MMQNNVMIQPMQEATAADVARLERECFADPWTEEIIRNELQNPLSLWLVAVADGKTVGYIGSQSVMDEADMMNLAVDAAYRKCGIGNMLICALERELLRKNVQFLCLEVRASNEPAIQLYLKCGYEQVGRRPRYYFHPTEDALILKKKLGDSK